VPEISRCLSEVDANQLAEFVSSTYRAPELVPSIRALAHEAPARSQQAPRRAAEIVPCPSGARARCSDFMATSLCAFSTSPSSSAATRATHVARG
jgi:hypothetical protein